MKDVDKLIKGNLLIIDDAYPHPRSLDSWRGIEINAYLDYFSECKIYSTMASIGLLGNQSKEDIVAGYNAQFPQYIDRFLYEGNKHICIQEADFVYFIFLNNVWENLSILEEYHVPFAFELYPGGGFAMDSAECDKKLEKVIKSQYFRGVIVSNIVTYHYVINKMQCPKSKILFVPGCVLNNQSWQKGKVYKKYFGIEKESFDIAFASYRYSEFGIDKGYDTFVEVAKQLHKISAKFCFHVVGNFDETVLDVSELGDSIKFYGVKETDWFNSFYQEIDVFISPNKTSILGKGTFDGFPTGCGIDAIIRRAVLIATDELEQNNGQYHNSEDIYIVVADSQVIVDRILFLYEYPHILKEMSMAGFRRARELYSHERQLSSRINFLESCLRREFSNNEVSE